MCESTGISLAVIELMSGDVIVSIWLSTVRKIVFRIGKSDESRVDLITVLQGNDAVARYGCDDENIRVSVATKGGHFTGVIDAKFLDDDIDIMKLAG